MDFALLVSLMQKKALIWFGLIFLWSINGHRTEQVACFKYLGIVTCFSGSKKPIVNMLLLDKDLPMPSSIFFCSKGGYIPGELFQAKPLTQLLLGTLIGHPACFTSVEKSTKSKFNTTALQIPCCFSNTHLQRR